MKQKNQLQKDLAKFEKNPLTAPISLQGSISATLVSFEKTIIQFNDYLSNQTFADESDSNVNKEKNTNRLNNLRKELDEFTNNFKNLKKAYNDANSQQRNQLFGSNSNTTSENPFSEEVTMNQRRINQNSSNSNNKNNLSYQAGLQNENSIFQRGNSQLDYILEMGQNSLNDIMEQNQILDNVQDKVTKSLRTLNVSEGTIQSINKRLFKDKLIFWIALFLMFLGMYLVLKYLR